MRWMVWAAAMVFVVVPGAIAVGILDLACAVARPSRGGASR